MRSGLLRSSSKFRVLNSYTCCDFYNVYINMYICIWYNSLIYIVFNVSRFQKYDSDSNGKIDNHEMAKLIQESQVWSMWSHLEPKVKKLWPLFFLNLFFRYLHIYINTKLSRYKLVLRHYSLWVWLALRNQMSP